MPYYETVTQTVKELTKRGFTVNFNLSAGQLAGADHNIQLRADEFTIEEVYRFEGETDPGDEMVVYAISSIEKGVKGILVNAFGVYSDIESDDLLSKLIQSHPKHN